MQRESESPPISVEQLPLRRRALRVAIVTGRALPEQHEVAIGIANLGRALAAHDHEVQIVRPHGDRSDDPHRDDDVLLAGRPIERYANLAAGLSARRALSRLWLVRRPDLVHITIPGPLGWSAMHVATKLRIPVCSEIRALPPAARRGLRPRAALDKSILAQHRKFHRKARVTIVPDEGTRRVLLQRGFRSLSVVGAGVDTERFDPARRSDELRRSWGAAPATLVVLHGGRGDAELTLAVLAFEAIRSRVPQAKLVLVGDAPPGSDLRARCPDAIVSGARSAEELATCYASGDLMLLPSRVGRDVLMLEAMASGLALIARDPPSPDRSEAPSPPDSGLALVRGDGMRFVQLAADVAADRARLDELRRAARARAIESGWDRITPVVEALYLSVADSGETAVMRLALAPLSPRKGSGLSLSHRMRQRET